MACKRCGNCCVDFSVFGVYSDNESEFLRKHSFLERVGLRNPYSEKPIPIFRCRRLLRIDNNTRVCSDYENRPDFCHNHPASERSRSIGCTAEVVLEPV